MLRSRLAPLIPIGTVTAILLVGCAGIDGTERGAIRENVIEPGITAIDDAKVLACGMDASTLQTALDIYEVTKGVPAPDEAALVEAGYLRGESEAWNVVDGRLVPEDEQCGVVPETVPVTEIVTEQSGEPFTVDDVLATFTSDAIDSVGGPDCVRQLAVVLSGASRYQAEVGVAPDTFAEIEAAGFFAEPVTEWQLVDDQLRPTDGSPCTDFIADEAAAQATACRVEIRTVEVARDAYLAAVGTEPTREDLIDQDFIRDPGSPVAIDLVDGVAVPVPGGGCDGLDLTAPVAAGDCDSQRRTIEVAVEAYVIQTGVVPITEDDLVTSGMLFELSPTHDLLSDGTVIAAPGGGCE